MNVKQINSRVGGGGGRDREAITAMTLRKIFGPLRVIAAQQKKKRGLKLIKGTKTSCRIEAGLKGALLTCYRIDTDSRKRLAYSLLNSHVNYACFILQSSGPERDSVTV